jgi:diguanylate cyclase (GGDEF)-like protein/PAS domain S-box-containing protein
MNAALKRMTLYFAGSVRRQLVWGVALVHALMMSLFVYDLTLRQHDFLIGSQTDVARNLARTLSLTAISPMLASDLAGLQEMSLALGQYPGVAHVMVIQNSGKILAHTQPDKRGLYLADFDRLTDAPPDKAKILVQNHALVDVAMSVIANGKRLGWIRVGVSQSATAARLESITTSGLLYTGLAIIVGTLLARLIAARLTKRLTNLQNVADAVRTGKMEVRAITSGVDELGHLARAFNFMLDALALRASKERELQQALQAEKELAQVTLASIGDAVITTDAAGRVSFLNAVAENYVGWRQKEAAGQPIADIFHVIDGASGQPVAGPLDNVLTHGAMTRPAGQAVLRGRHGSEFHIEDSVAPIFSQDGVLLGCVLVFRDVTEKHKVQQKLQWQAGHDALTGLPNRLLLADRFDRAIDKARRHGSLLAVCVLDLDQFKPINDTYGHEAGDQLLIQVTERLLENLRGVDTLCRLGGDEFVILFEDVADELALQMPLARILESLSSPFPLDDHLINVTASIGVTVYPPDNSDADTLIRHADQAMYLAKQAGRKQICWFDVSNDRHVQQAHQIISQVREALHRHQLVLHYQPKINMRSGEILGMEALLRWVHPHRGLVAPGDFLPQVEHSSLIVDIGEWVLETALSQAREWRAAGRHWSVSVNIAARHIQTPGFVEQLKTILQRYPDTPAHLLEIEILETVALKDVEQARSLILEVQQLGIDFSLDDFGTGYSSLKYLKRLPVSTLKIDQGFVRDILDDKEDRALVNAVIGLASAFNRKVIAEGVETLQHAALLLELGCELGQGYGIARPMPAAQVIAWADSRTQH